MQPPRAQWIPCPHCTPSMPGPVATLWDWAFPRRESSSGGSEEDCTWPVLVLRLCSQAGETECESFALRNDRKRLAIHGHPRPCSSRGTPSFPRNPNLAPLPLLSQC